MRHKADHSDELSPCHPSRTLHFPMSTIPEKGIAKPANTSEPGAETVSDVTVKAASAWVNQFARTLKTCRLYDANNPTVVRFRQELSTALRRLVDVEGEITLRFTQDDVLLEDVSLYPAKSRDDNLALPFHRDGVRSL